jgi:hypothetical protein
MRRIGWLLVAALLVAQEPSDLAAEFSRIKRVHVEKLSGGETASQLRDMIIASLQRAGRFVLTESAEKADAILRGSGEDLVYTDTFQSSDSLSARGGAGVRSRTSASMSVGETESTRIAERKHEAVVSVRLVNKDGDVIWSTTQESLGAKFRGASADVAEKVTRQLLDDLELSRKAKRGG